MSPMTFSVPPNQNYHLMTSCMAYVRLGCTFPSFSLQHFSPGGGLCRCCERCHFVRWRRDSSDSEESGLSKARMALKVRPSHGQTIVKSSSWGAGYELCELWSLSLSYVCEGSRCRVDDRELYRR